MRLNKTGAFLIAIAALFIMSAAAIPGTRGIDPGRFLPSSSPAYAGENPKPEENVPADKVQSPVSSSTLYQVMGVVLFIWIGLSLFLFRLDRRVAALEKHVKSLK